ncbi:hypothetical protein JCM33374_g2339 [Metschnikowia sp. JCM 33374]|nr:hypothetical protein JCM33374_g2339 [Metschnikowia sp. JCM 33374]
MGDHVSDTTIYSGNIKDTESTSRKRPADFVLLAEHPDWRKRYPGRWAPPRRFSCREEAKARQEDIARQEANARLERTREYAIDRKELTRQKEHTSKVLRRRLDGGISETGEVSREEVSREEVSREEVSREEVSGEESPGKEITLKETTLKETAGTQELAKTDEIMGLIKNAHEAQTLPSQQPKQDTSAHIDAPQETSATSTSNHKSTTHTVEKLATEQCSIISYPSSMRISMEMTPVPWK